MRRDGWSAAARRSARSVPARGKSRAAPGTPGKVPRRGTDRGASRPRSASRPRPAQGNAQKARTRRLQHGSAARARDLGEKRRRDLPRSRPSSHSAAGAALAGQAGPFHVARRPVAVAAAHALRRAFYVAAVPTPGLQRAVVIRRTSRLQPSAGFKSFSPDFDVHVLPKKTAAHVGRRSFIGVWLRLFTSVAVNIPRYP